MPDDESLPPPYLARIREDGKFVGTAFVIGRRHLATCWHVMPITGATDFKALKVEACFGRYVEGADYERYRIVSGRGEELSEVAILETDRDLPDGGAALVDGYDKDALKKLLGLGAKILGFAKKDGGRKLRPTGRSKWLEEPNTAPSQVSDFQVTGGVGPGHSGSPMVVERSGRSFVIGMVDLGGDYSGNSRILASENVISFVDASKMTALKDELRKVPLDEVWSDPGGSELARVFEQTLGSVESVFGSDGFPKDLFPNLGRFFTNEGGGGWRLIEKARNHPLPINEILDAVLSDFPEPWETEALRFKRDTLKGISEIVGGFAVLAVDPGWISENREKFSAEGIYCARTELDGRVPQDQAANFLEILTSAFADTCCRLSALFEAVAKKRAHTFEHRRTKAITEEDSLTMLRKELLELVMGKEDLEDKGKMKDSASLEVAKMNDPAYLEEAVDILVRDELADALNSEKHPYALYLQMDPFEKKGTNPEEELVGRIKGKKEDGGLELTDLILFRTKSKVPAVTQSSLQLLKRLKRIFVRINELKESF